MSVFIPIFSFGFFSSNLNGLFYTKVALSLVLFIIEYDLWREYLAIKISE